MIEAEASWMGFLGGRYRSSVAAGVTELTSYVNERAGLCPVLLVDDFPAELGAPFQQALIGALRDYPGQVFVSSIDLTPALAPVRENREKNAVFHVEHGSVSGPSLV